MLCGYPEPAYLSFLISLVIGAQMPFSTHGWWHTMAGDHLQSLLAHCATAVALSGFSRCLLPSRLHRTSWTVLSSAPSVLPCLQEIYWCHQNIPLASVLLATKSALSGQGQDMKRTDRSTWWTLFYLSYCWAWNNLNFLRSPKESLLC